MKETIAIVDIGANSVRLVLFVAHQRAPVVLLNEKATCGLGQYTAQGGVRNEALLQAADALQRFARVLHAKKPLYVVGVATAGLRNATDGAAALQVLEQALGQKITIIGGMREAELAAQGIRCVWPQARGMAADLGGGSLELVDVQQPHQLSCSTPLGVLMLRDKFTDLREHHDAATRYIYKNLPTVSAPPQGGQLFLIGGAWRALVAAYQQSTNYPLPILHGFTIEAGPLQAFAHEMSRKSVKACAAYGGVSKKRAETLPHAALLLHCLIEKFAPQHICISTAGIREGLFYELLDATKQQEDPLISAGDMVEQAMARFAGFGAVAAHFAAPLCAAHEQRLWRFFCAVGDVGGMLAPDNRATAAALYVLHGPFYALTHRERVNMAAAVALRYDKNFDLRQLPGYPLLSKADEDRAKRFAALLRLAHTVSAGQVSLLYQMHLTINPLSRLEYRGMPQCEPEVLNTLLQRVADLHGVSLL